MTAATMYGILLDLDETLVRTSALESLRAKQDWEGAQQRFSKTWLPTGTDDFLREAASLGKIGIVTSSPRTKYAEPLLAHHDLSAVRVLVASGDVPKHHRKPHPQPLLLAAQQLERDPRNCIYIGDRPEDMEAARAAGVIPIGVAWPQVKPPDIPLDAWRVCSTWSEVLDVIRELIATISRPRMRC